MKRTIRILKLNLKFIVNSFLATSGGLFSAMSLVLTFFSWEDLGITEKSDRFKIVGVIIGIGTIVAVLCLLFSRNKTLWAHGTGRISVIYGDIIQKAFPKRKTNQGERIIVIPVNTCFDTIIGNGLVSPKTIHGAWIRNMKLNGYKTDGINKEIEKSILQQGIPCCKELSISSKPSGNRKVFPQGSIAVVEGIADTIFYLLALSEFDDNLNAQCAKDEFVHCMQTLITYYNQHGQGMPLYIPLMGTGLSRAGLSHEESLSVISNLLKLNSDQIHGEVNIVVYNKDMELVSIHNS